MGTRMAGDPGPRGWNKDPEGAQPRPGRVGCGLGLVRVYTRERGMSSVLGCQLTWKQNVYYRLEQDCSKNVGVDK